MAANIIDITKYFPKASDVFFFDNNIWIYLFCPLGDYNKKKQKHYSTFLHNIITVNSTIFVNSMVLSEFANRYLRFNYELWKEETKNYSAEYKRDFVGINRYRQTVEEIKININKIIKFCKKTTDNFNAIDLNNVLKHLDSIDFNDSYYIELASMNNWKIVTDDKDFVNYRNHNTDIVALIN